jgi:hypothetical protein
VCTQAVEQENTRIVLGGLIVVPVGRQGTKGTGMLGAGDGVGRAAVRWG